MDIQNIAAIIFIILLAVLIYVKRKQMQLEKILFPLLYFIMYKAKWGIASMDKSAKKYRKLFVYIGYAGIAIGFIGMAFIIFMLIQNIYNMFFIPGTVSGVAPVLPVKAKGVFYVPFFYWIISIFIIAVIHEYAHGVLARAHDIKIKSSGLAFLCVLAPIIPAAFVEPDENELKKKSRAAQLSVFAAGPFANIILAFLILGFMMFIMAPLMNGMVVENGVEVVGIIKDANNYKPAEAAGIKEGIILTGINGNSFTNTDGFVNAVSKYKAGDKVIIHSSEGKDYELVLGAKPGDTSKPYLGVNIKPSTTIKQEFTKKYGTITPQILLWITGLLWLLFILSFGIGLFNLVPLGPIDGGRMLLVGLEGVMEKKNAEIAWKIISFLFLALIAISLIFAFVK